MTYWERRRNYNYYKLVKQYLEDMNYDSLLDVGSNNTLVSQYGDFKQRTALDYEVKPNIDGVKCIQADWMKSDVKADVITCLQVIEHFETGKILQFVNKIFESSKTSIISVPYMWREGACEWHKQDPIDVSKFIFLVGRDPVKLEIVNDLSCLRIVAQFNH